MNRPYHHGNLRATLIEKAAELAREKGPDGVVLREVARRAGVSHNAAYRHFADRDQLLAEVGARGMDKLSEHMAGGLAEVEESDPALRARLRLLAVGRAYVEFALAEPGYFDVAFAVALDEPPADDQGPATDEGPYGQLNRVLDELVEAGALDPGRREGAEVACWSAVHGFAHLHLHGPLRDVPEETRRELLDSMLALVDRGLEA